MRRSEQPRQRRRLPRTAGREAALLGGGLLAYPGSRLLGGQDRQAARDNAAGVLRAQRVLGLPSEQRMQDLVLDVEPLVFAANSYYAAAHLPVTALALLWLPGSHPTVCRRARHALPGVTGAAPVVYLLIPVAPPRMLPGFIDTAAAVGPSVYADGAVSALTNQYAAMPSLHVGWALLVALAGASAGPRRVDAT